MATTTSAALDLRRERIDDLKEWIRLSEQFIIEVQDEEPERAADERHYIEGWRTELRELEGGSQ